MKRIVNHMATAKRSALGMAWIGGGCGCGGSMTAVAILHDLLHYRFLHSPSRLSLLFGCHCLENLVSMMLEFLFIFLFRSRNISFFF